jgi:hypothetical protein
VCPILPLNLDRIAEIGCATYKWNLSRSPRLPVIFKLAIEMAASESQDRVRSSNGPAVLFHIIHQILRMLPLTWFV